MLAKIEVPPVLSLDSKIIEGKIYSVNLSDSLKESKIEVWTNPDNKKVLEFEIKPKETKEIGFSIPASSLKIGTHHVLAKIKEPNADLLTKTFSVESALSLDHILPTPIFSKNKAEKVEVKIRNRTKEDKTVNLELWLEKEENKVKDLVKEEVKIENGEEKVLKYNFEPDILEGRYQLISYLYSEDKVLAKDSDEIRIIKEGVPFSRRDMDFRMHIRTFGGKGETLSSDKLLSIEEATGLRRSNECSIEISGSALTFGRPGYTWQDYTNDLHKLHQYKVPFVLAPFNWNFSRIKYETLVSRVNKQVNLACEIGKEYFVGVRLSESEALAHGYVVFSEKKRDSDKVDAFAGLVKRMRKDIGLPEDKLLIMDVSIPIPYEWPLASGADVVSQAFTPIVPVQ